MSASPLPKGLHHLKSTVPHKFTGRFSPRVMPQKKFVQPKDRIARWNIRQGDYVRLLVGKKEDKFVNQKNADGGWKIHRVTAIDLERNTLKLNDVTYKKANQVLREIPEGASENERREFAGQRNFINISRPVHYSNVSLCIDQGSEAGNDSVFANRIATSKPVWDKNLRVYRYNRYAAGQINAADPSKYERHEENNLIPIPWPSFDKAQEVLPLSTDTKSEVVDQTTLSLAPLSEIWSKPETVPLATSSRAPVNKLPRSISDAYINANLNPKTSKSLGAEGISVLAPEVDTMMPLYLSEELSPRFSRAKATKSWNLAREAEKEEKERYARKIVQDWKAAGKDSGISPILSQVGLGGVKVRARTSKEVRESAEKDYENALFERSRIARMAKKAGGQFDVVNDRWRVEIDPAKLKREQKKKERVKRKEMFLKLNRLTV